MQINIVHETGFTNVEDFLLPTLLTLILFICFWNYLQLACVLATTKYVCAHRLYASIYKYTTIQGPELQGNYIIACRDQKSHLDAMSFQSSPKINCMLITTPICNIQSYDSLEHLTITV